MHSYKITATITARGPNSTVPDREDAVDATVYADGVEIGEVTLLRDDGDLGPWGSEPSHWGDDALRRWAENHGVDLGRLGMEIGGVAEGGEGVVSGWIVASRQEYIDLFPSLGDAVEHEELVLAGDRSYFPERVAQLVASGDDIADDDAEYWSFLASQLTHDPNADEPPDAW